MSLVVWAALALTPAAAYAQAQAHVRFAISAQDLGTALTELARQGGREIYFQADLTRGKRSGPLEGELTVEQALRRLLSGSGLTWRIDSRGSIVVEGDPPASPSVGRADRNGGVDAADLTEVIVTAQKRSELLADVPESVTVLSAETLERLQAYNFQDYLSRVPGLSLDSNTAGVSRLTLRGINTGGVGSTVAIYVDEVPFGSSSGLANGELLAGDFDTFDVSRIEVLRGPQGTLYGASSLGGLLKFVTNPPSTKGFEARMQAGVDNITGGGLGYSASGVVNAPLSDILAIRASGFYRFDTEFIDSIGNNPIASLTDPNINDAKVYGGRVSGLFAPRDKFSVRLTALLQNIHSGAPNNYEGDPVTLAPLYGGLVQSQYQSEFTDIAYRLYSGTVNWDLGPVNLLSSTSYGALDQKFHVDLAVAAAPLATFFFGDPVTRPLSAILDQETKTD
ncbi:MAG: TonB-dependent receptor plug domain-containing protein [Caulobacteraceae bacterium]